MAKDKKSAAKAPGKLSDYLCFAVYSANLAFGRAYKPLLEKLGLTYPQYATLVALQEESGQTVSQLGDKLFLESSTLTPLLKRLEGMGYITRQRDTEDERMVRVSITKSGRVVFEQAVCGLDSIAEATGLPQDEFVRLQRNLIALRDNLLKASETRN